MRFIMVHGDQYGYGMQGPLGRDTMLQNFTKLLHADLNRMFEG